MRAFTLFLCVWAVPALAGAQDLEVVRLPAGDRVEALATSLDEAGFVAASMPAALERVPPAEREGLPARIDAAYRRMHTRVGPQPSIWASSLPGASREALYRDVDGDAAVVFLHGYGGNFTWPCQLVAEAAEMAGMSTLCPSLDADARWTRGQGPTIVRESIALVRRRGARRVVLAGLSNGGVGASRLARRLGSRVHALLLISGVDGRARADLPALLIHGRDDTMVALGAARRFAHGNYRANVAALPGGHFVLADHPEDAERLTAGWLSSMHDQWRPRARPGHRPPDTP